MIATYGADMGAALYDQEYMVSYEAAVLGSYYGAEMAEADRQGRITRVNPDPSLPVHTAWDLGKGMNMAIWFFQMRHNGLAIVDYHQDALANVENCAGVIIAKGYVRGYDYVPQDARAQEIGTGRTRIETMLRAGLRPRLAPEHFVEDGINAVRLSLRRCWFDGERCADGIEALRQYQREWDEARRVFKPTPLHNWASHPADAMRYLCMSWREEEGVEAKPADRILSVGQASSVRIEDLWSFDKPTRRERMRV